MSDLEKKIAILFSGAVDSEFNKSITKVESGLSGLNNKVGSLTQPLASLAKGVEVVDLALLAMTAGGLAYSYNKAIQFESASVSLEKVLGDQAGRIKEAEGAALALSNAYGESSISVMASAASFKQAGFDYDESLSLVEAGLKLVIAGEVSAGEASSFLVSILKGFEAPASDAARVLDILNEVSDQYATNTKELATGMAELSPIAKLMGFSFEETAGLLTPVIEIFGSGSESARGLRTGLLKLVDDTTPVKTALASLGVSQVDLNGNLRSGKDILYDVMGAFQRVTENEKIFFTQQLVGIDQSPKMVKVFDNLAKVMDVTNTAMNSMGSNQREVNRVLESGEFAVKQFTVGFENLAIAAGTKFRDSASEAVRGATAIELALQQAINDGTFDEIFDIIDSFAGDLGAELKKIAEAMPEAFKLVDFSGLVNSLKDLGGELGELFINVFGDIDLTTPEGLAKAIQLVLNGFEKLILVTSGMVESFKPAAKVLGEWAIAMTDADKETAKGAGNFLSFGQQLNIITGLLPSFGTALSVLAGASMINGVANVGKLAVGLVGIANPLVLVAGAAAALGLAIGATTGPLDVMNEGMAGFEDILSPVKTGIENAAAAAETLKFGIDETGKAIELFPSVFNLDLTATQSDEFENAVTYFASPDPIERALNVNFNPEMEEYELAVLNIEQQAPEVKTKFMPIIDEELAKKAGQQIQELVGYREDGTPIYMTVELNGDSVNKANDKLKEIPTEKKLEIKLQGEIDTEIARIKAAADTVQQGMEWTAKVNIANAEADAARLKSAFENVGSVVTSSGDVIASLFDNMPDSNDPAWTAWRDALNQEMTIQKESWDQNKKLLEEQIKYMKIKNEKLDSGEPLITIDTNGLEPELEMVMWKIIEKVQIRATEEASEFLLGI